MIFDDGCRGVGPATRPLLRKWMSLHVYAIALLSKRYSRSFAAAGRSLKISRSTLLDQITRRVLQVSVG
jgi:hypothetical protein